MSFLEKHGIPRAINSLGTSTIIGANVAAPEVVAAAAELLRVNVEIDELQRAASRVIAAATRTEAGCVTSSASSGIAITCAAVMTGCDLSRIVELPDTAGLRNEIILQHAHDINFGGRISQMARISGAKIVSIGTGNHCDGFHLRGAINERTAAMLFVVNGDIHPKGDFIPLAQAVEIATHRDIPVIVDAAAEADVLPFVQAGASLVITSGQKAMGAPTSGLICGRKQLVRACYLQNWGIGRAMKVGKEGIAGLVAAVERWYGMARPSYPHIVEVLREKLAVRELANPNRVAVDIGTQARRVANLLREGDPPIWVNDADGSVIVLDLRTLTESDARVLAERLLAAAASDAQPQDDVAWHDLYWSERRLMAWPDRI